MKITRRQLQILILEEIRQVKPGCYKVYPKKPKRGKKRRKALSKNCKTKSAAKKHLAAIEISKSMNEDENPCWDGYRPGAKSGKKTKIGKSGKRVSNCEKINESLLLESKYNKLMTALPGLSLSVSGEGVAGGVALDLYDGSYLIASAILRELSSSGNPCIPNTMSISTIHVDASHQKLGVGEFLFDLIFYYASTLDGGEGYGITTDFEGGNTPIINYMIQRALQDPAYYKQRTSAGNDKMDFFGKTVDPDDDCYAEVFDDAGVYEFINDMGYSEEEAYKEAGFTDGDFPLGTTSSWRKRGIESMKPVWKMLTQKQSPGTYTHPGSRMKQFRQAFDDTPTAEEIQDFQKKRLKERKEPSSGTGKKPKGSSRRLYTDENPKDTVSVKFRTKTDIQDTLSKKSFKSKPHNRQSQIINLIHQRVRAAYQNAKDPATKKRLKRAYDYAKERKEASKRKTQRIGKNK